MKNGTMAMMAAVFTLGTAFMPAWVHADTTGPHLGFDRVGMLAIDKQRMVGERNRTAEPTRLREAPGEGAEPGAVDYTARKREMARRLVWLMLSAR